jgi:hypothetical protein
MDRSSKPGAQIDANCFHNRAGRARGLGSHFIVADPRFVDPANNDFRLQKESPCANAVANPAKIPQPRFMGEAFNQREDASKFFCCELPLIPNLPCHDLNCSVFIGLFSIILNFL